MSAAAAAARARAVRPASLLAFARSDSEIAEQEGLGGDFRLVVNSGAAACQTVFHLHLHIIGGKPLTWPPG